MNKEYDSLCEKHISTEEIFDGRVLHVIKDQVTLPDGKTSDREVIRHVGAVCMIPIDENENVIVERQFRYAVDEVITEIPAGKLNFIGEDYLEAAKRELKEETGLSADEWTELGLFYATPAYCDEKIMMFMARGLHEGERNLDDDEFLNVKKVPLAELVRDIMDGKIPDAKTQMAILKVDKYLHPTAPVKHRGEKDEHDVNFEPGK